MRFTDLAGRPVPNGRTTRTLSYPALTGTLPAWLAVPSGTGSWVDPVTALGHYRVSGTGTLRLHTIPVALDHPGQQWMAWTVQGVHFNATTGINPGIGLKADGDTAGVGIFHVAGMTTAMLRLLGTGQPDIPINYQWTGADLTRRRDLTIAVGVADSSVWLAEGDQVMHYGVYPGLRVDAALRGVLDASASASREMRILAARLDVETD